MTFRNSMFALVSLAFVCVAHAEDTGNDSLAGIVIERVVRNNRNIVVDFWSDQPAPYVVGVFHTAFSAFRAPRFPIARAYSFGKTATVRGDFSDCPVFVCVMSEPGIPTNAYYRMVEYASVTNYVLFTNDVETIVEDDSEAGYSIFTNHVECTNVTVVLDTDTIVGTNDFGLETMTEEQFGYYCRRRFAKDVMDAPNWRHWMGYHADRDGCLWEWNGNRRIDVDFTAPCSQPWRSEYVLLPPPFVSMSAHEGVRMDRSDDGMLFWQFDTNAVPDRIYPGGL